MKKELCYSNEYQNLLGERIQKAFSLVELIVVITILAILGTISFIAFQGFATDARGVKRLNDVRSLINKINIETTKGVSLEDLITYKTQTGITINSGNATTNIGIINFETLKENQEAFQDPLNGEDYKFAFAEGTTSIKGELESYKFIQMATVNEKSKTTQLVGNYYQMNSLTDSSSLFGNPIKNGLAPMIYNPNSNPYEGSAGVIQGVQDYIERGFTRRELIIKDGNGNGYTIMDRNLGTTEAYNGVEKNSVWGNYYQWGNNYGFPNSGSIMTSSILVNTATRPYSSSTFITGSDWVQIQNDDLWGNETNTKIARKGPCNNGRHIPSVLEWGGLFVAWCKGKGGGAKCEASGGDLTSLFISTTLENFQSDLMLPLAGRRSRTTGEFLDGGITGGYWSSSPVGSNQQAQYLYFLASSVYPQRKGYNAYGFSVRCFKN